MGNCGFALAPCRPEEREWFARCLTAVEDIPTEAMLAGIDWTWETFPEYLATVERLPKAINYGAYIGHSALRMYVMGKRALSETATEEDLARMAAAVHGGDRAPAPWASRARARTTHVDAGRHAGGEPHRRLVGGRSPRRRHGASSTPASSRSGRTSRAARPSARFLARLKQVALESGRPVMFGTISSRQGDRPEPVDLSARVPGRLRRGGRAHVGADHHALDQRDLLAQVLSAVRRAAGLARAARPAAGRAEAAPRRSGDAAAAGRGGGAR